MPLTMIFQVESKASNTDDNKVSKKEKIGFVSITGKDQRRLKLIPSNFENCTELKEIIRNNCFHE